MTTNKWFLDSGHLPTLIGALLYFDVSFMVWVLLGPLAPFLREQFHLTATQQGLLVAVPLLGGSFFRPLLGIGRSYLSPLGRAEQVRVRPPFKPCMRISRTRLTRWSLGRGMHGPRILNRRAQAYKPKGLEDGAIPSGHPAGVGSRARTLQEQPAES